MIHNHLDSNLILMTELLTSTTFFNFINQLPLEETVPLFYWGELFARGHQAHLTPDSSNMSNQYKFWNIDMLALCQWHTQNWLFGYWYDKGLWIFLFYPFIPQKFLHMKIF